MLNTIAGRSRCMKNPTANFSWGQELIVSASCVQLRLDPNDSDAPTVSSISRKLAQNGNGRFIRLIVDETLTYFVIGYLISHGDRVVVNADIYPIPRACGMQANFNTFSSRRRTSEHSRTRQSQIHVRPIAARIQSCIVRPLSFTPKVSVT